jgi:hypothetical protein
VIEAKRPHVDPSVPKPTPRTPSPIHLSKHDVIAEGSHTLAANSQRGCKLPDLLVAAAAEQAGYTVLHYDADFDLIASVTGQPCQWVAPPGTVD